LPPLFAASVKNSRAMRCDRIFSLGAVTLSASCLYGASFFNGTI
jgi:hypothetical protein